MKQITNKEYEEWQKYKPEIVTVPKAIIFRQKVKVIRMKKM